MSRLKVMLRGALISEIELNPEKEYIGGRKEGCDIRLQAEKGISREHFKLKYIEGQWQLSAISRFGDVFTGGQKIEQTELQHSQTFQVPPYEFSFLDVPDVGIPSPDNLGADAAAPSVGENDKTVIGAAPQVPYIKMVNSTGEVSEMLRLEVGDVWVAGRDPSCQIIIPDQRVSRRQFEIYKVNGAYTILDLASVNGTFLNGSPVSSTDPQTLKSGDAINVLDNTMYFELHDPNFRYKVEKIEVPPLQMDQFEEEVASEDFVPEDYDEEQYEDVPEIEEYEQYDVPQQMDIAGGPFTGMPGPDVDPNQYYTFQAPPPDPQAAAAAAAPATPLQKLVANKPLLIAVVLAFLGGAYYLSEMLNPPQAPTVQQPTASPIGDPFTRLSPAQQKEVEELYSLALQMYNQQKFELALEQIRKIEEILPTGYKDTDKIKNDADMAMQALIQFEEDERLRKEREAREAKIRSVIAKCETIINETVTSDEMSVCLYEVTSFDPNNADATRLREIVNKIEIDRRQAAIDKENLERRKEQMDQLFKEAEDEHQKGYAFKTIKKYQAVIDSTLPDTKKYKEKARERIKFIEEKILEKSQASMTEADTFFKEGKIREAVQTLRAAVVYDPDNKTIKDKIEAFTLELTRKMKVLYQESIIDENYGIIENTDSRQGAKEKWKKITELDLEDGEYYRKAVMKLRRYGVY